MTTPNEYKAITPKRSIEVSETKSKIAPLSNYIVLERDESETLSKGGIVVPEMAQDSPNRGVVLAVGPGRMYLNDSGKADKLPMGTEIGQRVLFDPHAAMPVKWKDEDVWLVREDCLVAVLS